MKYNVFDPLLESVFVINSDQKIIYCNEAAGVLLENSVRKLTKMSISDALSFSSPPEAFTNLAQVSDPSPYEELNFETSTGKTGKVQITVQKDVDGSPESPLWIVFFRDVTLEETLQKKYRSQLEQKESVILDLQKAREQLEEYSKNLEKMVEERTAEIRQLNRWMSALLDSLGQGFFIFNREGKILPVTSKACMSTLETNPQGQNIEDILKVPKEKVSGFKKWMMTTFDELLPFEDLAPLGPNRFEHSQNREVSLQYYPIRTPENKIDGIVVVSTDITDLVMAQKEAERDRNYAKMIVGLVKNKKLAQSFVRESQRLLKEITQLVSESKPDLELAFRLFHTLKGGAASLGLQDLVAECHQAEGRVTALQEPGANISELWQQIRLNVESAQKHFDNFMTNQVEILGTEVTREGRFIEIPAETLVDWAHSAQCPVANKPLAQEILEKWALAPLKDEFKNFESVIQSTAEGLGKKISPLKIEGDIRVWPDAYQALMGSLNHAFRNAVDHGIETPEERQAKGKNELGNIQIVLKAENAQRFTIEIQDDGNGIDPMKIRNKMQSLGRKHEHESDEQVIQHIFDSQFSTKEQVTTISGRGVGMDAVRDAAESIGGKVRVKSTLGKGTTLILELPWKKSAPKPEAPTKTTLAA